MDEALSAGPPSNKTVADRSATGYHPKSAIRILNASPAERTPRTRLRKPLYDEAARTAVIVLWEASDRVCDKRLRALLPVILPSLERYGHRIASLHEVTRPAVIIVAGHPAPLAAECPILIIGRLSHRPPIDLYLVNARGGRVPCDPSKGGVKLLRIIRIRKTTPEGDAVFCW